VQMRDVCEEMSIFVCFVVVLFVNVCEQWACELEDVELLVGLVQDSDVRLEIGYEDLRGDGFCIYFVKKRLYMSHILLYLSSAIIVQKKDNYCRQQVDNICCRQYLSSTGWLKAGYGLVMMMMMMGHI